MKLLRYFGYFINSLIYFLSFKRVIPVTAYVKIKRGKVVPQNWGDDINVFLIERMTGCRVAIVDYSWVHIYISHKNYACIGSILGWMGNKHTEVWGSGIISEQQSFEHIPKVVYSVRGPLTRQVLLANGIECPEKYGDPALILPRYYTPQSLKKYRLGIIPHYKDFGMPVLESFKKMHNDVLMIDLRSYVHWTDVIELIYSCEYIVSSSLHGLIVSDAYGIPNIWIKVSDEIKGGAFKYLDYFASVHKKVSKPLEVYDIGVLESIYKNGIENYEHPTINEDDILNSCPFKKYIK